MSGAKNLPYGIHLAFHDSKMTELPYGVFIPYDLNWGDRMDALKEFLITYYCADPDSFPYLFEEHMHRAEILRQRRNQCEKPSMTLNLPQHTD